MILIKLQKENVDEWGIIELQGELETRGNSPVTSQFVGDLHFSTQSSPVPVLIIGHHILYGKCITMEKPFAVLEKHTSESSSQTEYIVKAMVKKKLLFKIRPKPIIASVP